MNEIEFARECEPHQFRGRKAQYVLRMGGIVDIEGVKFVIDGDGAVAVGDTYIAERNTGPKLLTAKELDDRNWIIPEEDAYYFDTWECCKVRLAEDYDLKGK